MVNFGGIAADDLVVSKPTTDIFKADNVAINRLPRLCKCEALHTDVIKVDDIRGISDEFCSAGNPSSNAYGLTNMVWAFGQFIDHDIVGTLENKDSPAVAVQGAPGRVMNLHRVETQGKGRHPRPVNIHTGRVDGGALYGTNKQFEHNVLREPGTCLLRVSMPGFLPVSKEPDADGTFKFVSGDNRVDEHAILTSMHTLWLREHNRLCDTLEGHRRYKRLSSDRKYTIVRSTVIAKMQQVAVNEWLPALGISKRDLQRSKAMTRSSTVSVEFSVAFRFGHTLIPDSIAGFKLASLFDGQAFFLAQNATNVAVRSTAEDNIARLFNGLATEAAGEPDGRLSDSLRNILFGFRHQEDLAARNIFRCRDLGLSSYANMARCFGVEPHARTEQETPDAWLGLLREPRGKGQPLGPTHKAMLIEQFGRIFFGRQGLWWQKHLNRHTRFFGDQEMNTVTMAQIIRDNTGADVHGDAFKM